MIVPEQLRAIADELEEAQRRAAERLRALLNGTDPDTRTSGHPGNNERPARAVEEIQPPRGRKLAGVAVSGAQVVTQVPGAPSVATPAAGDLSRSTASGTADSVAPWVCADCGARFPSSQARGAHRRYKHPGPRQQQVLNERAPRTHTHLCDVCNRPFPTEEDLATHRLSHPPPPRGKPLGSRGFAPLEGGQ